MNGLLAQIRTRLGAFELDVELSAPGQGVTALFGRSGSGKTSLLRCIAGLQRAPGSRVQCGEEIWQQDALFVPPIAVPLAMCFRSPACLPI